MLFFKYLPGMYQGADHTGRRVLNVGGGGGPSQSTVTQSNIPEWLRPQTEALLGAATQEYFTTEQGPEGQIQITGMKPFVPYSTRPGDYVAGFTPQQEQAFFEAANLQTPGGFGAGSNLASAAGQGAMQSALAGYQYGQQGQQSGLLGQELGISGGEYYGGLGADYGGMGAGYGGMAAGLAPEAQFYGQTAADIGAMGLRAEELGRDVGQEAREYARQAASMGGTYERMATDPTAISAYMSPYQSAVSEIAKQRAIEDAQRSQLGANLGAVRQGTYGGARQALAQSQREAALQKQLSDIETQGLQTAYDKALEAQRFGVTTGLQGLQGAQAGLGTTLQGGQLGLSGIGQALAGQQAGLAGLGQAGQLYGLGMQGAQTGLQGVQSQLAGTAQGMQGAQAGLQGVGAAQAGYGLAGQQAQTLANIAQQEQAANIARLQFQQEMGAIPQAQEQKIIDQAIQNYAMAQESPYQRLAQYSGLIRGYATPTTTVEQYSAPASPISQLAGLGTAAYGFGVGRKEGGKIEEGIDTALLKRKRRSKERVAR